MARSPTCSSPGPAPEGTLSVAYDPAAARKTIEALGLSGQRDRLSHGPTAGRPRSRVALGSRCRRRRADARAGRGREARGSVSKAQTRRPPAHLDDRRTRCRPQKYWGVLQAGGRYDRAFRNPVYDDAIAALVEREERALYPERRDQSVICCSSSTPRNSRVYRWCSWPMPRWRSRSCTASVKAAASTSAPRSNASYFSGSR